MSGKPSPEGVQQLIAALREVKFERQQLHEARTESDIAKARVRKHEEALEKANGLVNQRLDEMDLRATGNFGYAERFWAMLLILVEECR